MASYLKEPGGGGGGGVLVGCWGVLAEVLLGIRQCCTKAGDAGDFKDLRFINQPPDPI